MAVARPIAYGAAFAWLVALPAQAQERPTDEWLTNPVDRATFDAYREFFTYPDVPFETEVLSTDEELGVREQHLRFQGTPGIMVPARLYQAAGIDIGEAPAIVYLHGGIPRGKDAAGIIRRNRLVARAGVTVLSLDMQYFGERDNGFLGSFGEMEKHEALYNNEPVYLEWMQQSVKDVGRAYEFLVDLGVDPDRIGLTGVSRGAVVAAIAGGADERFQAVALVHVGHFDFFEDGHRPAACPANYIGRIAPRPVFFLSSETDGDFLPETAIKPMHRLAGEPHTIHWSEGGHGSATEQELTTLAEWLREALR